MLDLVDEAVTSGWSLRRVCHHLELGEPRVYRWLGRRAAGVLADRQPGLALHGLLPEEVSEIVALFHEWGELDRSHRKLAHRGSYLHRVWVSPSSVRRVLAAHGLRLRPRPRAGRSTRTPFPHWVEYRPNQIWIYDTTHFTAAGAAVTVVEDLVSRKWLATIVSAEETSIQVQSPKPARTAGRAGGHLVDGLVPSRSRTRARPGQPDHREYPQRGGEV